MKVSGTRSEKLQHVLGNVADFGIDFCGDLAKFLIVLTGLWAVAGAIHLVKITGIIDTVYVEWFERVDGIGDVVVIIQLVLDFNLRLFASMRRDDHAPRSQRSVRR